MRFRLRGPSGTHTVTLDDGATINDLCSKITELTDLIVYDIKAGFPPKPLDITQLPTETKLADTGFKFNGEQLIVAQKDLPGVTFAKPTASHSASMTNEPSQSSSQGSNATQRSTATTSSSSKQSQGLLSLDRKPNTVEADPPSVSIPSRGGRMILRVMPDDNSCLFRSLSTVLLSAQIDGMTELRSMVADAIQSNPEVYYEAVLGRPPDEYCRWIKREDSWGGYVDVKAIAEAMGTEVVCIDVQTGLVTRYAEGSEYRCFVVYSGIHYDALAFVPDGVGANDSDFDQKQFPSKDDAYLEAAKKIGAILKERNYFTDTAGFTIKCGDCGWVGQGEKAATKHAESTGHMNFQEG